MPKGPKGEKRPADLNRRAFDIVRIASGEVDDVGISSAAQKGGKAGGTARARAMSPEERRRVAQKAAKARWDRPTD